MKIKSNRFILLGWVFIFILALSSSCLADQGYGTLKVFTEIKGSSIYVDGELAGHDTVIIKQIEPGTHYVKVEASGKIYYDEVVTVVENETETVLVKDPAPAAVVAAHAPAPASVITNYLNFFANYSDLSLSENVSGVNKNYGYDPAFGIGVEYNKGIAATNFGANMGINYNFPSNVTLSGFSGGRSLGISHIYFNLVSNAGKNDDLEMNFAIGLNYSFWAVSSPLSTINGGVGYQGYYEFLIPSGNNYYSVKIGHATFYSSSNTSTQSSSGLFLKGGFAY
ncbi:MAG: PEGA domain-containing protein [Candidatus Margulisbacteria bacterium]|nr:PEGA domain-containing protein [Candidatus Margulisiibacteriota bacterium]MBU1728742.1 PEGA domain-containing protein [Candidatus Margulisiibacteriota bacterium]MBU1955708.1 PEGA domain-containing protein [Candidatus Margulisiibacteriota bacterium]